MTTRRTLTRAALAVALLVLAGVFGWVALARESSDLSGVVPGVVPAVLALVAARLLFTRPAIGAILAILVALLGAGLAVALNLCLCPTPPLGPAFVALVVAAAVVFALALLELATLGFAWLAIAILIALAALSGIVGVIAVLLLIAASIAWRLFRRRRSGSGASANES
jgi:hypothetical protein